MKRQFALLLFIASSTFAVTGCGETDYSDIPEVDAAETAQKEAEIEKQLQEEMERQTGGGGAK
ncbi:MAG: hypothetical protein GY758_02450 [Fuerstiella sp.]|nr:hypothetical protein [Fuerstiella sp.]